MGIVNVTPDSFSDGGRWFDPGLAAERGFELARQGADILDVGGESTRPGADPVPPEEEARRILPVIRRLAAGAGVPVTADTRRPEVARLAVEAGACAVNCVAPFPGFAAMADAVRETGAGLVAMHARGTPRTMAGLTAYEDVVGEVEAALRAALDYAEERGIPRGAVLIDPGIGFAKTAAGNLALLAATARLARLAPVLVGLSRKRFIGELCGEPEAAARDGGSVGAAVWCARRGAAVLRAHDARATRQALTMARALDRAEEEAAAAGGGAAAAAGGRGGDV